MAKPKKTEEAPISVVVPSIVQVVQTIYPVEFPKEIQRIQIKQGTSLPTNANHLTSDQYKMTMTKCGQWFFIESAPHINPRFHLKYPFYVHVSSVEYVYSKI